MRCFTGLGLMSIGEGGPRLLPDLTYAEATQQYDIVLLGGGECVKEHAPDV